MTTAHGGGNGNGREYEYWMPALYFYNGTNWVWGAWGMWNWRDSAPSIIGGAQAWEFGDHATNSFATWWWGTNPGYYVAVYNWNWSQSAGYGGSWAYQNGDTAYPWYCLTY